MKQLTSKTRLKLLGSQLQLAQIDAQARKQAAAVLEVLAGLRTPQQAAHELSLSLPTYFNLETRALRGLTFACCRQAPGRQQSLAPQLRQAQDRVVQLERQLGRYQALLRSAQAERRADAGHRAQAGPRHATQAPQGDRPRAAHDQAAAAGGDRRTHRCPGAACTGSGGPWRGGGMIAGPADARRYPGAWPGHAGRLRGGQSWRIEPWPGEEGRSRARSCWTAWKVRTGPASVCG